MYTLRHLEGLLNLTNEAQNDDPLPALMQIQDNTQPAEDYEMSPALKQIDVHSQPVNDDCPLPAPRQLIIDALPCHEKSKLHKKSYVDDLILLEKSPCPP